MLQKIITWSIQNKIIVIFITILAVALGIRALVTMPIDAGRAETATDPAGLDMLETTILLKTQNRWRKGMTPKKLIDELDTLLLSKEKGGG